MAEVVEPATTGTNGVGFELDRFEMADGERFEVGGRWFGVRGRRFIRPSLTLVADEEQRRLLADLEHKPWAAEDGEPWEATFPYEDGGRRLGRGRAERRPRHHDHASAARCQAAARTPARVCAASGAPVPRGPRPPRPLVAARPSPRPPHLLNGPGHRRPSSSRRAARRIARSASSSDAKRRSRSSRPSSSAAAPSSRRCRARATPPVLAVSRPPRSRSGWCAPAARR